MKIMLRNRPGWLVPSPFPRLLDKRRHIYGPQYGVWSITPHDPQYASSTHYAFNLEGAGMKLPHKAVGLGFERFDKVSGASYGQRFRGRYRHRGAIITFGRRAYRLAWRTVVPA